MSHSTDTLGTFRDKEGHWHPVSGGTVRCFRTPEGARGTVFLNGLEIIRGGRHCGLMLGHDGPCDTTSYDTEWDEEVIT